MKNESFDSGLRLRCSNCRVLRRSAVFPVVIVAKKHIGCDHRGVDDVQRYNPVPGIEIFMDNPGDIANHDKPQKEIAFRAGGFESVRFGDREGPRCAKTDQHDNFKYAHLIAGLLAVAP